MTSSDHPFDAFAVLLTPGIASSRCPTAPGHLVDALGIAVPARTEHPHVHQPAIQRTLQRAGRRSRARTGVAR
ncbi:MAG: hypothetical protein R2715_01845 [Ilumatobacteraceae bacterium]